MQFNLSVVSNRHWNVSKSLRRTVGSTALMACCAFASIGNANGQSLSDGQTWSLGDSAVSSASWDTEAAVSNRQSSRRVRERLTDRPVGVSTTVADTGLNLTMGDADSNVPAAQVRIADNSQTPARISSGFSLTDSSRNTQTFSDAPAVKESVVKSFSDFTPSQIRDNVEFVSPPEPPTARVAMASAMPIRKFADSPLVDAATQLNVQDQAEGTPTEKTSEISTLGSRKIQFSDAKHFLSTSPRLKDPSMFLVSQEEQASSKRTRSKPDDRKSRGSVASKKKRSSKNGVTRESKKRTDVAETKRSVERPAKRTVSEFADVDAPISIVPLGNIYQNDTSGLLVDQFEVPAVRNGDDLNYAMIGSYDFVPSSKSWLAPNFYHNPLYFEEVQLERYGNQRRFQHLASTLHFFGRIPVLPYMIGTDPVDKCVTTYGRYRPGDCVPYELQRRPLDRKGLLSQAFWTTAIALP